MDFLQRRRVRGNDRGSFKEINWAPLVSLITIVGVVVGLWQNCDTQIDRLQEELSELKARVTIIERINGYNQTKEGD
jgi:hypothetical protein